MPFYIRSETIELSGLQETSVNRLIDDLIIQALGQNKNIVVYLHGYNVGFGKSCRQAAMFQRSLGLNDRLLLFSWPADGNFLKYTWDEADLVWSVSYLSKVVKSIARRIGRAKIDVVAHSLGARGAVHALSQLVHSEKKMPLVNELLLLAPDIDRDTFKHELPALHRIAKRITVYVSENDKALKLSNDVHGHPRLGEAGEFLSIYKRMETIDISLLGMRRFSGHLYHLFSPEVNKDLSRLLRLGWPASRRPGLQFAEQNGRPYWRMLPTGHP